MLNRPPLTVRSNSATVLLRGGSEGPTDNEKELIHTEEGNSVPGCLVVTKTGLRLCPMVEKRGENLVGKKEETDEQERGGRTCFSFCLRPEGRRLEETRRKWRPCSCACSKARQLEFSSLPGEEQGRTEKHRRGSLLTETQCKTCFRKEKGESQ